MVELSSKMGESDGIRDWDQFLEIHAWDKLEAWKLRLLYFFEIFVVADGTTLATRDLDVGWGQPGKHNTQGSGKR